MTPGPHVIVTATTEPVAIWSGEHRAWWRANRCGYTNALEAAGVYSLADAIDATHHVGPEKQIEIRNFPTLPGRPVVSMSLEEAAAHAKVIAAARHALLHLAPKWRETLQSALRDLDVVTRP